MKKIVSYVKDYFVFVDKRILVPGTLLTAIAVFFNYRYGLNQFINSLPEAWQYFCWYFLFLSVFGSGYLLFAFVRKTNIAGNIRFVLLLLLAPAIFAWKMAFDFNLPLSENPLYNEYWNRVIYWPFKLLVVTIVLFFTWKLLKEKQPLYGLSAKNFRVEPYLLLLACMLPLIAAASTRPDFLVTYPKLKNIAFLNLGPGKGLLTFIYELSYGSDFFTIEFFFRGFLVLAFTNWFGRDAVLPMAMFYCTIHFGKPAGECISSFFGGLILGAVTFHTRSIFGGFIVHVGIAWLMELGGYLGNHGVL